MIRVVTVLALPSVEICYRLYLAQIFGEEFELDDSSVLDEHKQANLKRFLTPEDCAALRSSCLDVDAAPGMNVPRPDVGRQGSGEFKVCDEWG